MSKGKVEVLSPAGDPYKLRTVVLYGADAVYMSGKSFGLRTFSGNFTHEEMVEGIAFAHAHGVKCYVTMNILATEEDLKYLDDEIDFVAHVAKADAVLVSDPGIFARIRKVAPDLEIHISTQASVTNSGACETDERGAGSGTSDRVFRTRCDVCGIFRKMPALQLPDRKKEQRRGLCAALQMGIFSYRGEET